MSFTGKRYFHRPVVPVKDNPPRNEHAQFKPGASANPGAVPKNNGLRGQPKLTRAQLCEAANDLLTRTPSELQDVMRDKSSPMLDVMLSSVMIHIARTGDMQKLNSLLDRLIGKVKETVEITPPKPFVMRLPGGDLMVMGTKDPSEEEPIQNPIKTVNEDE